MSSDTDWELTPSARLHTAAEQLRLASVALTALAGLVDDDDLVLEPHIEHIDARATELMRTAGRLAREMGMGQRWGMDILFASAGPEVPVRHASPDESIELEPLELLQPIDPSRPIARLTRPAPPWTPYVALPTPPIASVQPLADENGC